jgi:hypothetical protein
MVANTKVVMMNNVIIKMIPLIQMLRKDQLITKEITIMSKVKISKINFLKILMMTKSLNRMILKKIIKLLSKNKRFHNDQIRIGSLLPS